MGFDGNWYISSKGKALFLHFMKRILYEGEAKDEKGSTSSSDQASSQTLNQNSDKKAADRKLFEARIQSNFEFYVFLRQNRELN